jgi:deoxyhypusine synthase
MSRNDDAATSIAPIGTSLEGNITEDATVILQYKPLAANSTVSANPSIPSVSASAVLGESTSMPDGSTVCKGHDFNASVALDAIMDSLLTTGFQATNLGLAVDQIRQMRSWRLSDVEWKEGDDAELKDPEVRSKIRARIFLAYTSNQISSGQREVIKFLVQHKMVDVIISTAGGVEEDLVKCFQPTFMGDFKLCGRELRKKGINRIGNLLVPNMNYCEFEDWISPIFQAMHDEQDEQNATWAAEFLEWRKSNDQSSPPEKFVWAPSTMIARLGKEINDESSVLYWASKNEIPIYSPALTDGSIGDMLYFHSYKRRGFVLDIAQDIRGVNDKAVKSHATGMIILGGGLVKHHCCNANLMRNGADFSVYVNTGQDFDGSDSGASPDEAISWGKIRITAKPVKVCGDATIVFPLIVSQTFAKDVDEWNEAVKGTVCHVDDLGPKEHEMSK